MGKIEPHQFADEMEERIARFDWRETSLGDRSLWPAWLTTTVDLMLAARAQIVIFWDDDFIAMYNDAYIPTIGAKHPAALGRPAREHWSELWSDLEPLLRKVLTTGETFFAKDRPFYMERHGYGETIYFDVSYSAIRDADRNVRGVLCLVTETTDRVRSEQALRDSEAQMRAIVDQTATGIAQIDTEGRFTFVNRSFCRIVGYSESELLAMRMQDITYADDLPENMLQFEHLVASGHSFDIEKRYVRKDGSLVWVANALSGIFDAAGRIQKVVGIVIDINERKRAQEVERQLAAIIASADEAILSLDLDMRIESWNAGAEKLFGYSAGEAIGQSIMMLIPEERGDEETEIFRRIRRRSRVEPFETQRLRSDGALIDVSLTVSPIFDVHGRVIGASKILHDITARKEVDRLQSILIRELHHRVKNLFATVMAVARQTFGKVGSNRPLIGAFSDRLIAMAKAHDLLTQSHWKETDLRAAIEQSLSPYSRERLEIDGPRVMLTPKALLPVSMVLHELATNASKYGAFSSIEGRISVTWSIEDDRREMLLIWQESGGPTVEVPTEKGFGSQLIESLLAGEIRADVRLDYRPGGLRCEMRIPLSTHDRIPSV